MTVEEFVFVLDSPPSVVLSPFFIIPFFIFSWRPPHSFWVFVVLLPSRYLPSLKLTRVCPRQR